MKKVQARQNRRRPIPRKKNRSMSTSACIGLIILMLCITGLVQLKVQTRLANINSAIDRQVRALEDMDKTYKDMTASLDEIKNSDDIMRKAKFQLGMVYPDNDQVKYIDVAIREKDNDVNENVYLNPVISVLHIFNGK